MASQSAVITGIGLLTPVGVGVRENSSALREGRAGILFGEAEARVVPRAAGRVPVFDPRRHIADKKSIKVMSRQTVLASCGLSLAREDSGVAEEAFAAAANENAVILGPGMIDGSVLHLKDAFLPCTRPDHTVDYDELGRNGYRQLPPLWILPRLPNTAAGQLSIQHHLQGLNLSIVNGPSNGIVAIGEASLLVRDNRAPLVVCGGAEGQAAPDLFYRLEARQVASQTDQAGLTFCEASEGCVCSEAAAILILESADSVRRRQASGYAAIVGYANRYLPRYHQQAAEGLVEGHSACMRAALLDAQTTPDQVAFIQAAACGIPKIDGAEALAIRRVFGRETWVTSSCAYVGYPFAAAGAVSTAHAALQLREGFIAPLPRAAAPMMADELRYATEGPVPQESQVALVNSFDFFGGAVSLVLRREEP